MEHSPEGPDTSNLLSGCLSKPQGDLGLGGRRRVVGEREGIPQLGRASELADRLAGAFRVGTEFCRAYRRNWAKKAPGARLASPTEAVRLETVISFQTNDVFDFLDTQLSL